MISSNIANWKANKATREAINDFTIKPAWLLNLQSKGMTVRQEEAEPKKEKNKTKNKTKNKNKNKNKNLPSLLLENDHQHE